MLIRHLDGKISEVQLAVQCSRTLFEKIQKNREDYTINRDTEGGMFESMHNEQLKNIKA